MNKMKSIVDISHVQILRVDDIVLDIKVILLGMKGNIENEINSHIFLDIGT